jgi:hypothetical protein
VNHFKAHPSDSSQNKMAKGIVIYIYIYIDLIYLSLENSQQSTTGSEKYLITLHKEATPSDIKSLTELIEKDSAGKVYHVYENFKIISADFSDSLYSNSFNYTCYWS